MFLASTRWLVKTPALLLNLVRPACSMANYPCFMHKYHLLMLQSPILHRPKSYFIKCPKSHWSNKMKHQISAPKIHRYPQENHDIDHLWPFRPSKCPHFLAGKFEPPRLSAPPRRDVLRPGWSAAAAAHGRSKVKPGIMVSLGRYNI